MTSSWVNGLLMAAPLGAMEKFFSLSQVVLCSLAIHQIEAFPYAEVARAPAAASVEARNEALGPVAEGVEPSFGLPVEAPT